MIRRSGSFASPGTRVSHSQTDKSNYRPYIIQAIIGAIGSDVILVGLIIVLLTIGWPILFVVSLFLAYYGTLTVIGVYEKFTGNALSYQESVRLAIAFVVSIAISDYFFISDWWTWLIAKEMVTLLIIETVSPLKLPSWVYYSLIGLWFFGALNRWGKITFVAILACLTVWTISQIDYTYVDFDVIWSRLRYIMATLTIPWMLFGFILVISMTKEMIAPNLNFILETIPWDDYKQAGGIYGLLFPKLIEWREKITNRVSYNIIVNENQLSSGKPVKQKRRSLFAPESDAEGLAKFAIDIFKDIASFSERGNDTQKGATSYGYTQSEYKELRKIAYKLMLLDKRGNKYTLNDRGVEALEGVIERVYGVDFIP